MFKQISFRTALLLIMALFLMLATTPFYAQDDDYDDDYYDEYYDDEYYDDYYYDDDYYDDYYYDDYYDDFEGEDFDEEDVIARYEVDGLDLLDDPEDEHLELWTAFVTLIPAYGIDGVITYFEVIDDADTAGYVYGDEDDEEKFVLGLSLVDLDNERELRHTIIHEYGHIVTLNADQIDMRLERGDSCPTFELDEGCSEDDSYVFAFYEAFYEGDENEEDDAFVTDYASENIAEDMAESFTYFILRNRPDGETVAQEKILFFYDYDELVDLRDDIRGNMD